MSVTTGPNITYGTYNPTYTSVANLDATPTSTVMYYFRVGNTVTVYGAININPTVTLTLTQFRMSLPIASAFTGNDEAGGMAIVAATGTNIFSVVSVAATDDVIFNARMTTVTALDWSAHFSYIVK